MNFVLIGLAGLMEAAYAPQTGFRPEAACEVRPDAPYINPRLPLGRASYAQWPACRTTWAHGDGGPSLYVQGPPIQVDAPPIFVGGLRIYLVPPEVIVRPSSVTVEPPQVVSVPAPDAVTGPPSTE